MPVLFNIILSVPFVCYSSFKNVKLQ